MNWLQRLVFRAKTGADIATLNDGNPVDRTIIQFKGHYLEVITDTETGEPVSWGWSDDPMMFHVPVRDFWKATPPSAPTLKEKS